MCKDISAFEQTIPQEDGVIIDELFMLEKKWQ